MTQKRAVRIIIVCVAATVVAMCTLAGATSAAATSSPADVVALPSLGASGVASTVASTLATSPATSTPVPTAAPVPAVVPTSSRIANAVKWIKTRKGVDAFAVMDSSGHLSGYHMNTRFVTASVVKAMLLAGYLRTHSSLSSWARSTLTTMIHVSDNTCATAIYHIVGDSGLRKLAKAARMRRFSVSYSWGHARLTPADQARYFFSMDRLIPSKYRRFARHLLSNITPSQSWGIPATARSHGWAVFFKGGWRGTSRGQLVHQIARLERGKTRFSIAVMTDGDPTMGYGIQTIAGVTRRLLGLSK